MVNQLGRSFTWAPSRTAVPRTLEVSVTVRGGRTRVTIHENLTPLIGRVYGPIGGGMGGGGIGMLFPVVIGGMKALPPTHRDPALAPHHVRHRAWRVPAQQPEAPERA